jgi:hypothetical protein
MIFHPVYYGNRIKHHDFFLDVAVIRKGLALTLRFTENLSTLPATSTVTLIIHHMLRKE